MLQDIIDKIDPNIKLYVTVDDKKYYIPIKREVTIFALNIILVIENVRKSYRISVDANNEQNLNPYFAKIALNFNNNLDSFNLIEQEPLIFLKDNRNEILKVFEDTGNHHIAYGKVLGYAYTGEHWYGMTLGDTYGIDNLNEEYCLFSFNVPVCKYNVEMKNKILNMIMFWVNMDII